MLANFKSYNIFFQRFRLFLSSFYGNAFFRLDKRLFLLWDLFSGFLPKTRKSNWLSKLLRPLFEHKRVRGVFGIQLISSLVLVNLSIFTPVVAYTPEDVSSPSDTQTEEVAVIETPEPVVIATKRSFYSPVDYTDVSQGFHPFHLGVDLRAALNSEVKPIASGVVTAVDYGSYGYGNYMVIKHFNGYSSLYAHVSKIQVSKDASVDEKTVIAKVGMTGSTTGPHLHLEVYRAGIPINPKPIIGY